jgi:hypothetical protein
MVKYLYVADGIIWVFIEKNCPFARGRGGIGPTALD